MDIEQFLTTARDLAATDSHVGTGNDMHIFEHRDGREGWPAFLAVISITNEDAYRAAEAAARAVMDPVAPTAAAVEVTADDLVPVEEAEAQPAEAVAEVAPVPRAVDGLASVQA